MKRPQKIKGLMNICAFVAINGNSYMSIYSSKIYLRQTLCAVPHLTLYCLLFCTKPLSARGNEIRIALVIGGGDVASVAIHKMVHCSDVFNGIYIAS